MEWSRAALRSFGNPATLRDQTRNTWSWQGLEMLLRDLRGYLRREMDDNGIFDTAILFGESDDGGNVEIAARAFSGADGDGLIRKACVEAVAIGFGVNGDRANAQIFAGADDAQGDLAAVGDQNFFKHAGAA